MAAILGKRLAKCFPDSNISQLVFPPPSTFNPLRDIPDPHWKGAVAIVTGGAVGIGYYTVLALLQKNARVYIVTRSVTKANEAIRKLREETGREAIFLHLDLADHASVRRAAREFTNKEEKLDILFNNAGVMLVPLDQLGAQGYDLRTNALGHYYFTSLLKPLLNQSTRLNGEKARVVFTSSSAFEYAPGDGIEFDVLKGGPARDAKIKEYGVSSIPGKGAGWMIYGISKFANVLTSNIFQHFYADELSSYSVNPGGIRSELQRHGSSFEQVISKALLKPTPYVLYAGTMPEAGNEPGGYFIPWARVSEQKPRLKNVELQMRFKEWVDAELRAFEEASEGGRA
ncbi:hypothetical protein M422DRAFT_32788 [Sphaerobolus stellatus SS14]|uniref:Protochlorophyllide reductase n=1 Tax=Sphaerobolus stellatus (strain SS14) TaxID=990650 RepID=A0A0C9VCY9_SPHS4|nr:hypothetical protein M422DRAFT_32788 [Sphaerobolus stellatus SS14]